MCQLAPAPRKAGGRLARLGEQLPQNPTEPIYLDYFAQNVCLPSTHETHVSLRRPRSGQRILPTSCGSDKRPAYCDADGRREIIKEGAQLALEFELSVGGQATVHATGYYLPTR